MPVIEINLTLPLEGTPCVCFKKTGLSMSPIIPVIVPNR